jgi:hypothetical protein
MNRRTFCRAGGLLFSGAWLARCGFAAHNVSSEPYPAVADIEKSIADNRSALRHISTHVNGLRMHALAPANREVSAAPAIGSGAAPAVSVHPHHGWKEETSRL